MNKYEEKSKAFEPEVALKITVNILKSTQRKLSKAQKEIAELKSILLEVGATTHKNKRLHKWYCKNKQPPILEMR